MNPEGYRTPTAAPEAPRKSNTRWTCHIWLHTWRDITLDEAVQVKSQRSGLLYFANPLTIQKEEKLWRCSHCGVFSLISRFSKRYSPFPFYFTLDSRRTA